MDVIVRSTPWDFVSWLWRLGQGSQTLIAKGGIIDAKVSRRTSTGGKSRPAAHNIARKSGLVERKNTLEQRQAPLGVGS